MAAFSLSRDLPGGSFFCISDSCDMLTSGRNSPPPFYLQCSWHGDATNPVDLEHFCRSADWAKDAA